MAPKFMRRSAPRPPHAAVLHAGAPWLVSRASLQSLNRIYVWEC